MSKIETRILEATRKIRETVEELRTYYEGYFALVIFQIVLVFVSKAAEKVANKVFKLQ